MPSNGKQGSGADATGSSSIAPLGKVPVAFAALGAKINELVAAINAAGIKPSGPLRLIQGTHGQVLSIDHEQLSQNLYSTAANVAGVGGGGGGSGLPTGYIFHAFSVCSNGSPVTYYWPTWDSDPS